MARTNMAATRVKPATEGLVTANVLRRERLSANFARVTLGGGELDRFQPLGYDQWFRLFLPVPQAEDALTRLPGKLNTTAYLRYLAMAKATRPVLRNYSVRAFRRSGPEGPELDVDFVLHGADEGSGSGPAAAWAQTCRRGDPVALLDEGVAFNPPPDVQTVLLVADETGLPAVAGIAGSLPDDTVGQAVIEIAAAEDQQSFDTPPGFEVTWVVRDDPHAVPGRAALAEAMRRPLPDGSVYGWVVGEQALPTGLRRHWVAAGVPKQHIMFCGYWRVGRS